MGMPIDESPNGKAAWEAAMRRLAQARNVVVKLSGFGIGRFNWTIAQVAPLVLRVVSIFGVDRCLCGSNLPFDRLFGPPARIVEMLLWIAKTFGPLIPRSS